MKSYMKSVTAKAQTLAARLADGVTHLDSTQWDDCTSSNNPFVSHAFLSACETSGSVGRGTGWKAAPIVIENEDGMLVGALPAYFKGHSQGEYVFDHSWAQAWERAGGRYYPKLQIAAPFTPAPGPRVLAQDAESARILIAAAESVVDQHTLSSAHATFIEELQVDVFREAGWLIREGVQFHWTNKGYTCFDDFLEDLSSRKRKNIRKERATAIAGLEIVQLSGAAITETHWDAFWVFYQDTGARKWGTPYLTRAFFTEISQTMADKIILFLALRDGRPIAGALNFISSDTLYGRYWGCVEDVPCLHFELCYYQAIEVAIARGLARVEAGAQGEHKLARGYVAVPTWSAHYIANSGFRGAVEDFIDRERIAIEEHIAFLGTMAPFKHG
jgi:predicted N-acyltransferase